MRKFKITIKFDNGKKNIITTASNDLQAIINVITFENCPKAAIIKIKELPF